MPQSGWLGSGPRCLSGIDYRYRRLIDADLANGPTYGHTDLEFPCFTSKTRVLSTHLCIFPAPLFYSQNDLTVRPSVFQLSCALWSFRPAIHIFSQINSCFCRLWSFHTALRVSWRFEPWSCRLRSFHRALRFPPRQILFM